jgi:two-component system NtrC family response regulator
VAHALVPVIDGFRPSLHLLALGVSEAQAFDLRAYLPPDSKLDCFDLDDVGNGSHPVDWIDSYDAVLVNGGALPASVRARSLGSVLSYLIRGDARRQMIVLVPSDDIPSLRVAVDVGARDVLDELVTSEEIVTQLRSAARLRRVLDLRAESECASGPPEIIGQMIGASLEMRQCFGLIRQVSATQVPVLITGESGTGKELAARAVHDLGARASGPFVPINCAAIPEPLLESELFGHERGAFTGATHARPGRVEIADGGTLFLDEIGELALAQQGKLLRFLEDHVVQRIGGRRDIPIDVRVIAATNRDLYAQVEAGTFREDLYYRLAVFHIALPPLKERSGDAVLLARFFLDRYAREHKRELELSRDAEAALQGAPWPGNVREMINRVRRAVVVAEGPLVRADDLGLAPTRPFPRPSPLPATLRDARRTAEVECILRALERSGWNKTDAARDLGVSRTQLYDIMNRHGIAER